MCVSCDDAMGFQDIILCTCIAKTSFRLVRERMVQS